jgi:hypothetical protein
MTPQTWNALKIGARWDDDAQNARFERAREQGLLEYVEVNYPISAHEDPSRLGLPLLAHTSNNPLASIHGIDEEVCRRVRDAAHRSSSPWIGECPKG